MTRRPFLTGLLLALAAGTASAETLREALVLTYANNPTLTAQREALRGRVADVQLAHGSAVLTRLRRVAHL